MPVSRNLGRLRNAFIEHITAVTALIARLAVFKIAIAVIVLTDETRTAFHIEKCIDGPAAPPGENLV